MGLFNSIINVIYFSIFNNTSCGKYNVLGYGIQEANTIDVHEVTSQGDFLVFTKDALGDIWYYDVLHMLDLVADCSVLKMWYTGTIDVPSHTKIFLQSWEICRMLLSTACRIWFNGWPVMCWNSLDRSDLFKPQVVYCFLFYSTCGMGEHKSFTKMCTFFLFVKRCLMSW